MAVSKRGEIYHYCFMMNDILYRGSTKQKTLGKARNIESQKMEQVRRAGSNPTPGKAPLLSEAAAMFLLEEDKRHAAGNSAANTRRHYHNGVRMLGDTAAWGRRVDQITRGLASTLVFPGDDPWTHNAAIQTLGRILNWSVEKGWLHSAPKLKRKRAEGRSLRLEPWIQEKMLEHLDQDCADVMLIMLDCGLRPDEVMRMRWDDMHWERREYFNRSGKTKKSRRFVPISNRMEQLLRARQGNRSEWVFPSRSISPAIIDQARAMFAKKASVRAVSMSLNISWPMAKKISLGQGPDEADNHRVTVALQWEEARAKAGLDNSIVLYLARHMFGTTYLEHGGNLATLMTIMGHESISTTSKYLHGHIEGAAEVIDRRNSKSGPGAGPRLVRSA